MKPGPEIEMIILRAGAAVKNGPFPKRKLTPEGTNLAHARRRSLGSPEIDLIFHTGTRATLETGNFVGGGALRIVVPEFSPPLNERGSLETFIDLLDEKPLRDYLAIPLLQGPLSEIASKSRLAISAQIDNVAKSGKEVNRVLVVGYHPFIQDLARSMTRDVEGFTNHTPSPCSGYVLTWQNGYAKLVRTLN